MNSWVSIIHGHSAPDPISMGLRPKVYTRPETAKAPHVINKLGISKKGRAEILKVVSALLFVCRDSRKIYDVLEFRGLNILEGNVLTRKYITQAAAQIKKNLTFKPVKTENRIAQLLSAGMKTNDVVSRLDVSYDFVRVVKRRMINVKS